MSKHDTDPEIKALKQEAFDLKVSDKIKISEALDKIAVREGYKNWMRLLDAKKK